METQIITDVIEKSFDVSPTTVYGVLVGLLVLGVIYALRIISKKDKKLYELNADTISVLVSIENSLEEFRTEQQRQGQQIGEHIKEAESRLLDYINKLKNGR